METEKREYHGPKFKTSRPITSPLGLQRVKEYVSTHVRDNALCLFALNTAYRGGDILSINIGDVRGLQAGDEFGIEEQKTGKYRRVTINDAVADALAALVASRPDAKDDDPLFINQCVGGQKFTGQRLTIQSFSRLVKKWCKEGGQLREKNYSTHSLRKTFGYQNRVVGRVGIEVLQSIYGHSSAKSTLTYIAIQPEEIREIFMKGI